MDTKHFSTGRNRVDAVQLSRSMWLVLAFIGTVVLAGFALTTGNPLFMLGFVALPFALMLMYRPDIAFVLAFLLDATGFDIPGVSYTTLGLLAKMVIVATVLLAFSLLPRERNVTKMAESRPLKFFVALIIILMATRGAGLRVLGSSTWGGMIYVVLLAGIAFFFAVRRIRISRNQIRFLIWGMAVCGLMGSITTAMGWEAQTISDVGVEGQTRALWLEPFVMALFPLVFSLRWKKWFKPIFWMVCLGLIAFTGYRSILVGLVMITAIYSFFKARTRSVYIILVGLAGIVLWCTIIVASPHFPKGMQRAVSFVPGATVDVKTLESAEGSIDWRVEIWRYCLGKSKQYLLLGRGSAFNVQETAEGLGVSDIATYSPWFAFETRSYHSGPLSLLIDYGLPGFIIGTWLMVLMFRRFWKNAVILGRINTLEGRFALYWCAYMLWYILAFYLVYGSMVNLANRILAPAALAIVLYNSVMKIESPSRAKALAQKSGDQPESDNDLPRENCALGNA